MTQEIQNPVLPGFHPDPSICRRDDDYYIATSTFHWWPGVRIHHSRDLVNWRHAAYAVTRRSQLDLEGRVDSGGVWAPCLSYSDGRFWLVYSDVRCVVGPYRDCRNYLVTAEHIEGPWSEPVYLNGSGFDASLFHDDDGRRWLLNPQWIHHPGPNPFNGILLQEYDPEVWGLVGPVKKIFDGTALGAVEGPHIYKRDGWYYLLTAEGGTFFEHAATLARSRRLDGPYEVMPGNPLLTSWRSPRSTLQRAGHASWVDTPGGEWFMAHLCGRPNEWNAPAGDPRNRSGDVPSDYGVHCSLGRETALQKLEWQENGWPCLAHGGQQPSRRVMAPAGVTSHAWPAEPLRDDFDAPILGPHWNSLRVPMDDSWLSLQARPGHLRLFGRESPFSPCEQSLVGRRLQHHRAAASTRLSFDPQNFQQMAGLAAYYDSRNYAYLYLTVDPVRGEPQLRLSHMSNGVHTEPVAPMAVPPGPLELGVDLDTTRLRFRWRTVGGDWHAFGDWMQSAFLSDEHAMKRFDGAFLSFGFTGTFLALCCQDLAGTRLHADFDHFDYEPQPC